MTIRELMNLTRGMMHNAKLIVVGKEDLQPKLTLSLGEIATYREYADYEIKVMYHGVETDYVSDFTLQGKAFVKPQLIIQVLER
jgi:hypothetical protein